MIRNPPFQFGCVSIRHPHSQHSSDNWRHAISSINSIPFKAHMRRSNVRSILHRPFFRRNIPIRDTTREPSQCQFNNNHTPHTWPTHYIAQHAVTTTRTHLAAHHIAQHAETNIRTRSIAIFFQTHVANMYLRIMCYRDYVVSSQVSDDDPHQLSWTIEGTYLSTSSHSSKKELTGSFFLETHGPIPTWYTPPGVTPSTFHRRRAPLVILPETECMFEEDTTMASNKNRTANTTAAAAHLTNPVTLSLLFHSDSDGFHISSSNNPPGCVVHGSYNDDDPATFDLTWTHDGVTRGIQGRIEYEGSAKALQAASAAMGESKLIRLRGVQTYVSGDDYHFLGPIVLRVSDLPGTPLGDDRSLVGRRRKVDRTDSGTFLPPSYQSSHSRQLSAATTPLAHTPKRSPSPSIEHNEGNHIPIMIQTLAIEEKTNQNGGTSSVATTSELPPPAKEADSESDASAAAAAAAAAEKAAAAEAAADRARKERAAADDAAKEAAIKAAAEKAAAAAAAAKAQPAAQSTSFGSSSSSNSTRKLTESELADLARDEEAKRRAAAAALEESEQQRQRDDARAALAMKRKAQLEHESQIRKVAMQAEAARLKQLGDISAAQLESNRLQRLAEIEASREEIAAAMDEENQRRNVAMEEESSQKRVAEENAARRRDGRTRTSKKQGHTNGDNTNVDVVDGDGGDADGADVEDDPPVERRRRYRSLERERHLIAEYIELTFQPDIRPLPHSKGPYDVLKNHTEKGVLAHLFDLLSTPIDSNATSDTAAPVPPPLCASAILPLTITFSSIGEPVAVYHTDSHGSIRCTAWSKTIDAKGLFLQFEAAVQARRRQQPAASSSSSTSTPGMAAVDDPAAILLSMDGHQPGSVLTLLEVGSLLKNGHGSIGTLQSFLGGSDGFMIQVYQPPFPGTKLTTYRCDFTSAAFFQCDRRVSKTTTSSTKSPSASSASSSLAQRCLTFKGSERSSILEPITGKPPELPLVRDTFAQLRKICVTMLRRVNEKCKVDNVAVQRLRLHFSVNDPYGPIYLLFGDRMDLRLIHPDSTYSHQERSKAIEKARAELNARTEQAAALLQHHY